MLLCLPIDTAVIHPFCKALLFKWFLISYLLYLKLKTTFVKVSKLFLVPRSHRFNQQEVNYWDLQPFPPI